MPSSPLTRRGFLRIAATTAGVGVLSGCGRRAAQGLMVRVSPPLDDLQRERRKTGDRHWRVHHTGAQHDVEGFAVPESGLPGEPVDLFLSSRHRRVRIEALRIGWYGGAGARRVWHRDAVTVPDQSARITFVGATRTVGADWHPTIRVRTDGWPEGAYLFKLTSEQGAERFVPFIVRSADAAGRVLLVHATATWQAYNDWGGYSLYHGPGGLADYDDRAYVVSMDRPFPLTGADGFMDFEQPVVALAERLGLPVAHTTSSWLHAEPALAARATAVISLGHDEYWSPQMRANVTTARDRGVNLAFLGANACYRRIRFRPSPLGPDRQVICYKTDYQLDPLFGKDNASVTNDWRSPPHPDPESSLIGTFYEAFPTVAPYVVVTPDAWVFRGTGARAGDAYADLIGPEYDRVNPAVPLCRPMTVLSHSPLTCDGVNSYSDSAYYTHRSGAGVVDTGSMHWVCAITGNHGRIRPRSQRFATRVTANILRGFSHGPAADRFPVPDNVDQFHEWPGDPIAAGHNLWTS